MKNRKGKEEKCQKGNGDEMKFQVCLVGSGEV